MIQPLRFQNKTPAIFYHSNWNPALQDDPADASAKSATGSGKTIPITLSNEFGSSTGTLTFGQDDHYDYLRDEQRTMIDVMGLQDRTLLYSGSFEGMIQQQGTPYGVMILFDPEHDTIFFHMTHM